MIFLHTFFSKSDFLKFFDQIDHKYEAVVVLKKIFVDIFISSRLSWIFIKIFFKKHMDFDD